MDHSRRPTRRDGKRHSIKARPLRTGEPTDDSPLSLLRAQLERVEAQRAAVDLALANEKEARAADARELGEMLARVSLAEGRTRAAQLAADELSTQLEEERRQANEREARYALVRSELESLRAETRARRTDVPPRSIPAPPAEDSELRRDLEAAREEAKKLRESLEGLQKRAAYVGTGLREMRELMVQSADLFDELEARENAICEIRAKSLRDARTLFLRAAGRADAPAGPPPLPGEKAVLEDLSEAAELLEEEVRASLRPGR